MDSVAVGHVVDRQLSPHAIELVLAGVCPVRPGDEGETTCPGANLVLGEAVKHVLTVDGVGAKGRAHLNDHSLLGAVTNEALATRGGDMHSTGKVT